MILVRVFFALIIGFFLIALYAPYDPWVKYHMGASFKKAFGQAMDCSFEGEVTSVNILSPTLTFANVSVKNNTHNNWDWTCKEYKTGFSWSHFFTVGTIDMWVEINDMCMNSLIINDKVQIADHLQRLINPTKVNLPLQFKNFSLHRGSISLRDITRNYQVTLLCSGGAKRIYNDIKTHFYISDSSGIFNNTLLWHNSSGSLLCDIHKSNNKTFVTSTVDISTTIIGSDAEHTCFITGSWNHTKGRFSLQSADDTFSCNPCIITSTENGPTVRCSGRCSLKELIWMTTGRVADVDGKCFLTIDGPLQSTKTIKIYGFIDHGKHKKYDYPVSLKVETFLKNWRLRGKFSATAHHYSAIVGLWDYDIQNKKGKCSLYNTITTYLPYLNRWHIKPHDFKMDFSFDTEKGLSTTYDCIVSHNTIEKKHTLQGIFKSKDKKIILEGSKDNDGRYDAILSFDHYPCLQEFVYRQDDTPLLTALYKDNTLNVNTNFILVRNIMCALFDRDIQAEGNIQITCLGNNDELCAKFLLDGATIRLPQTYNFIDGGLANMAYNWREKKLHIHTVNGSMHCGTFHITDGICIFDKGLSPSFIHIPLIFNRCLLNIKRDLFVMLSGSLLFEQQKDAIPAIRGSVIVDQGQIKENILSQEFQKQIGSYSKNVFTFSSPVIETNIALDTRNGIKIDTPFLKTTAKVSLKLTDNITKPSVSGSIVLSGGSLQFPYRPLEIARGIVTFDAEKGYDPSIELFARNQIRNHRVSLHITGSLLDHHIALESSPPLTDEQIIGLLMAGSAEESLKNMMPALIMNNLKSLIFGSNQYNFLNKYFRPLGNAISINLIPSFTDQSGRGGLRGALEITVNDRWRAMIQRSFNFTEDTRVELEYLFADDITLRGLRDERKNIALEAEMRWKF